MADDFLNIKSNIDQFTKNLDDVAKTQIPFATALAINAMARVVVEAEQDQVMADFPSATPFTRKSFSFVPARKESPFATVFVFDAQAKYLEPYTDGGQSVPTAGGAMVVPKAIQTNQYGNIPYKKLRSMIGNNGVFYANKSNPQFRHGRNYSGIFQRQQVGTGPRGGKITKLITLAKIQNPWNVRQHFGFFERAEATAMAAFQDSMEQALLRALGSMR